MGDITQWLERARGGDRGALDAVFAALHPELRRIARARLAQAGRPDRSLETAVLVNECYLKLVAAERVTPADRAHFLAYAAHAMRSVIVDLVRAARRERRGGDALHVTLCTEVAEGLAAPEDRLLEIDAALDELARLEPRLARVVEMRFYAGMTEVEIGEALGLTERTVRRDWEKARLLLAAALRG